MTIADLLAEQVRARPAAIALIEERTGRRLSYADLAAEVAAAAAWLEARGIRRGDGVLLFVPVSIDLYVALLALFRLGAVALLLDLGAGPGHVAACCERWPPAALLAVPLGHLLRLRCAALRRIPRRIAVGGWFPGADRWPAGARIRMTDTLAAVAPDHPALVTFTSGSTGVPKAAVRTHGFLLAQLRAVVPHLALEAGEVDLATLPVFTLASLAAGVQTVLPAFDLRHPGRVAGADVAAAIARHGVTRLTASPALLAGLARHAGTSGKPLSTLRKIFTGGAPVFARVLRDLADAAPQARVTAVYGSTEAEPIAHVDAREIAPEDEAAMGGGAGLLAGRPVAELKLKVLRDRWGEPRGTMSAAEFAAETLATGAVGEIVVSGTHVLAGYLDGVGEAETKFTVGAERWHRTGDAGWLDPSGRLWLAGRCAARIVDETGVLYPFAAECVAMQFPAVRQAAFVAHAGRRWLLVAAAETPELRVELAAALAWAKPDVIRFRRELPVDRRHNAKIDYPALRRELDRMG